MAAPPSRRGLFDSRDREPLPDADAYRHDRTPLGPGKLLVNPEYIDKDRLPPILKYWEILDRAGARSDRGPVAEDHFALRQMAEHECADAGREARDRRSASRETMRAMEQWGLEPIPCDFMHYAAFGGSFHCATLDVQPPRGLQSYF